MAMQEILGGSSKIAVYYLLKERGLNTERLGEDLQSFEKAMTELFLDGWLVIKNEINTACESATGVHEDLFPMGSPISTTGPPRSALSPVASKGDGFLHGSRFISLFPMLGSLG